MAELRIAISGKSGCGNSTVSFALARRLGVRLINYTFHSIAEERGITFEQMCLMAEADDSWDRYLDEKQVELAREESCVLGSRLAIWLLSEADLTVYLTASGEVRAERIRRREGGDFDGVLRATNERDMRDRTRYLRLYDIDIDVHDFADMTIDTERYTPDEIVELIVTRLGV